MLTEIATIRKRDKMDERWTALPEKRILTDRAVVVCI